MSADSTFLLSLAAIIWIGWPLHNIAGALRALLNLARKNR